MSTQRRVATTLNPGTVLSGKYVIEAKLGGGGMGQVFRAVQQPIERLVAVKVLHPKYVADPDVQQRFLREAKAASQLTHPNAITVYDFGQAQDDLYYIVMEYVEGESLGERIGRDGVVPLRDAIPYMIQVAQSLGEAHRKGIIHRDLKPDNIMVTRSIGETDQIKVLDFGIAKLVDNSAGLTQTGSVFGTPGYMAPEQARGKDVDPSADFYALTCCLYEALMGELPYTGGSAVEVMMQHQTEPMPTLDARFPDELNHFVASGLAKEPAERIQTAEQFIAELMACFVDEKGEQPDWSGGYNVPTTGGTVSGTNKTEPPQLLDRPVDTEETETREGYAADASLDEISDFGTADFNAILSDENAEVESGVESVVETDSEASSPGGTPGSAVPDSRGPATGEPGANVGSAEQRDEPASTDPSEAGRSRTVPVVAAVVLVVAGVAIGIAVGGGSTNGSEGRSAAGQASAGGAEAERVSLEVVSEPEGALVLIDGRRVGVTPVDVKVPREESFDIAMERDGFERVERKRIRAEDYPEGRFFSDMRRKTVSLKVVSPIDRAVLEVGGESYGRVPAGRARTVEVEWPEEQLQVTIDPPGFAPFVEKIPASAVDGEIRVAPDRSSFVRNGDAGGRRE